MLDFFIAAFGIIANAIMFIPVGFMLPLLWKQCEKVFTTIGLGASSTKFFDF